MTYPHDSDPPGRSEDPHTTPDSQEAERSRSEEPREGDRENRGRARWEYGPSPCGGGGRRRRRRHGRKERVLHTRISEPLAEDIRRIADELRVPVSNIVRNVLEEAFSFVETVTDNVGDLVEDVADEADRVRARSRHHRHHRHRSRRHRSRPPREESRRAGPEPPEFPDVVGWQPLILNQDRSCADCGEPLERGERVFAGLTGGGLSETTLCSDCMEDRR